MSEYRTKEEEIKARMVRTASRLWGQPNSSAESFDPLVGMLLGACSVEMGRVYNELESSQARILERLAGLLTPEVQRGPKAAHAILQARANEPVGDLSKEFHFYYQKKLPQRENSLKEEYTSVYFTPVANTRVFDARVAALASGNSIWSIDGSNEKSLIAQSRETRLGNGQAHSLATSIYIGIDISRRVKSLNGMSFYFDWPFSSDKTSLYQSLENSKLFLGTKELKLSRGFQTAESFDSLTSLKSLLENDLCRIEEREIAMLYHPRFLTINDESEISLDHDLKNHPQEFSDVFDASALKQFNQPLLWLRLDVFSPRADISKDIQCLLNCFPIMSRHLNEFSYRLQSNTNIIPLKVDGEVFYSMCSLRGSDNKPFVRNTTKDFTKSKSGTFLLRQGGIERFDKRDASELLNYLIDLLRDESAAFAVYGNDLISSNLRELNQMLNSLIQRVEHTEVNDEQLTYLVIKPIEEGDNVF